MVKSIVDQLLTIHQASMKCGVSKSTLRFWERRFSPFLDPIRSPGGQRRYSERHLSVILRINALKQQGLGLQDVYHALSHDPIVSAHTDLHARVDALAAMVAVMVKKEVFRFFSEEAERGLPGNGEGTDALLAGSSVFNVLQS